MTISEFINRNEQIVKPFTSIASIEEKLIEHKYLVLKDGEEFIGLLTVLDVVKNYHYLAVDCYTEKPIVYGTEKVHDVLRKMTALDQKILPVFDEAKKYIGSVVYEAILTNENSMMKNEVNISFTNLIGDGNMEKIKQLFLSEMLHNTKNPIQVIYSSVNILKDSPLEEEQIVFLNSILTSTKQIDVLITRLFETYFSPN